MENLNKGKPKIFYLVLSRKQLAEIWKKANIQSIKLYGKKRLESTIVLNFKTSKDYPDQLQFINF